MILESVFNSLPEKNKRIAVVLGIAGATIFLAWVFVAKPAFHKISALEDQTKSLRQKGPILSDVLNSETQIAAHQKFMSPSRDIAPLMGDLADLAEKSGLKIASISPEKSGSSAEGQIEKLSVAIEAMGSFHSLGDFISRVENLDKYFVKVSKIDFARAGSSSTANSSVVEGKRILLSISMFFASGELASV